MLKHVDLGSLGANYFKGVERWNFVMIFRHQAKCDCDVELSICAGLMNLIQTDNTKILRKKKGYIFQPPCINHQKTPNCIKR